MSRKRCVSIALLTFGQLSRDRRGSLGYYHSSAGLHHQSQQLWKYCRNKKSLSISHIPHSETHVDDECQDEKLLHVEKKEAAQIVQPYKSMAPRRWVVKILGRQLLIAGGLQVVGIDALNGHGAGSQAAAITAPSDIVAPKTTPQLTWPLGKVAFSLLPLAGTSTRRATVEETIIPEKIWTHDQLQGIVNVNVPVRQTVIKLSDSAGGGLWVHNPVAPTPQLLKMMRELEKKHGLVRHIVLGTAALEHKATFGPFAQNFPHATVWIQPGQWSFPLDVPIEFLGVTKRGSQLRELPNWVTRNAKGRDSYYDKWDSPSEWLSDFEYETLGPLKFKSVGGFSESAFFHKATKTLLVTDTVVSVTEDPPLIIAEDPRAMLFHARDSIKEVVQDTPETRKRGWRRMVQFGLIFFPSKIEVVPWGEALKEAIQIDPRMKVLGEGAIPGSLYPWKWHADNADLKNFKLISNNGKLFCPPILTKLILDREPEKTIEWANKVAKRFDFRRIIPCHLNNNIQTSPKEFREAFDVLTSNAKNGGRIKTQRPLDEDLALLQRASDVLTTIGIVDFSKVCDGEPARVKGRFAKT